jgi:hypothetical protein
MLSELEWDNNLNNFPNEILPRIFVQQFYNKINNCLTRLLL